PYRTAETGRHRAVERDAVVTLLPRAATRDGDVERIARDDVPHGAHEPDVGLVEPQDRGPRAEAKHQVIAVGTEEDDLALVIIEDGGQGAQRRRPRPR